MADYCSQADQECVNPPGYRIGGGSGDNPDPPRIKSRCLSCGEPVCKNCSLRRRYYFNAGLGGVRVVRDRMCHGCVEQKDGNDVAVMRHIYRLIGE